MTLLCDSCALLAGYQIPSWDIQNNNYTGHLYQVNKFFDHTITGNRNSSGPVSLLDDPTYDNYKDLMIDTLNSGYYEIDAQNRVNKGYYVGNDIGSNYDPQTNTVRYKEQFFKVVKFDTPTGVHGFSFDPVYSAPTRQCDNCSRLLW